MPTKVVPSSASFSGKKRRMDWVGGTVTLFCVCVLAALATVAIMGPMAVTGFDPNATDFDAVYQEPSRNHWAGTDSLGRDLAARLIAGSRISLLIAGAACAINILVGVTVGALAGYVGGRTDRLLMRLIEVLYGIPTILVVIMLMIWFDQGDQGIQNILLAIGLTYWLNMARLVRAEVMSLKNQDFVAAARATGAGHARILLRHILPNAAGTIVVAATLFIPEAIFTEAFLSFIGLGVPAPEASWGSLAADGSRALQSSPWLLWFPAGAICLTMLAFNLLGEKLRDKIYAGR